MPDSSDLELVHSDDFLPSLHLWVRLGDLFLLGTIGAALALATLIKYTITVKAPAVVRPVGETRIVQATREGIIKTVLAKENQLVKLGEAIATIDSFQLQTEKSQLEASIENKQRQISQIIAQLNSLDRERESESDLMERTVASATADLSRSQRDYQDRQIATQTEVQEAQAALDLARVEFEEYQQLASTGAIARLQIKQKKQAFVAAIARLKRAKATLNPSAAPVTIAAERVAQEQARGKSTLAKLNQEREETIQSQVELQNQLSSDRQKLQQIQSEIEKSIIKASTTGSILKLNLRNSDQVVSLGESIAEIAPSNAPLVVKARVAAQDISKIQVCKEEKVLRCTQGKVQLRVSAYPYPDYGTLRGGVRAISPDVITPQSDRLGVTPSYYEVTIEPEKLFLKQNKTLYPIISGMEITADITFREETVLTFFLRQLKLINL